MISLERYESLIEAESLADLHSSCATISKELGYNHFLYGVRVNTSLLRPYQFIFSGYPHAWRSHYDASEYASIDPTVLHCQKHVVPIMWEKTIVTQKTTRVMDEARDFGLVSGATFPVRDGSGFALLSLASDRAPQRARKDMMESLPQAQLFACYLHEAVRRLVLSNEVLPVNKPALTAREKECLLWAAEGKTAWEVSKILNISECTIVFHLGNAAEKMGASNSRQAVVRAVSMGLISP